MMSEDPFELPDGFGSTDASDSAFSSLKMLAGDGGARLQRIHAPIEAAIKDVMCSLDELSDGPGWETLRDVGGAYLEDLLGIAFTVAQTQIKAVDSSVHRLSQCLHKKHKRGVKDVSQLLDRAPRLTNGVSVIRFASAIADFWKHESQWDARTWQCYEGEASPRVQESRTPALSTARSLKGSGMEPGSTGQVRQLVRFCGITNWADLAPLRTAIVLWTCDILIEIESQFGLS